MVSILILLNIILISYCIVNITNFNYAVTYMGLTLIHMIAIVLLINVGGV